MKKIFILLFITIPMFSFGQKFVVTPNGLRDSTDIQKTYLVIDFNGFTSKQLYDKSVNYIKEKYKDPSEVIKSQIENEYLKFNTHIENFIKYNNSGSHVPITANFTTELKFKDGKIRYEITNLNMMSKDGKYSVLFSGGLFDGYIIFKKNGNLFKEEAKIDIEKGFNNEVEDFLNSIKKGNSKNDW